MKANELMIGDYVKFLGRVRKINSIIRKDTGVEISFEGKNPVVVSLDEIEPVALTPEILEKNGFEKDPESGEMIWTDDNVTEVVWVSYDVLIR